MPLIKCENVTLSYESNIVCKDLNFSVNEGNYLCIVGENGSGKSTLVKALLGLKSCTAGQIVFDNNFSRSDIGYLPQQTQIQRDFPASVFEVVLSGCLGSIKNRPFFTKEQKLIAVENLTKLGISDIRRKSYRDLSGGQQQRVLLARALCAAKKILLLDEPVSGLDPMASARMYDIINKLNLEHNMTIIMVSHDINSALLNATHVLHIKHGGSFFGTKNEYLNSPTARDYLGGGLIDNN